MRKLLFAAIVAGTPAVAQQPAPPACADLERYGLLDFWVGDWVVYSGDEQVGTNRIEKVLDGCAVLEHWTGSTGSEGKSLFYVVDDRWKQVWVTGWATRPGGVKEKSEQPFAEPDAVRFQGRIRKPDGTSYLDRTTLTPMDDGSVRQLIEVSGDEGETWQPVFDAIYRKTVD